MASTVHQLKVTLRNVKPPIWRRIVVPSYLTLGELSIVLLAAMGWTDSHLHVFEIGDTRYGMPDPEWDDLGFLDEDRISVGKALTVVGSRLRYEYDFGDGWEHDLLIEGITLPDRTVKYPLCLAGRRACPPEDCGGPWGYGEILELLANPTRPDPEEIRAWVGPDFDPKHFDVDEATAAMRAWLA
ncbi:MAG: hypothetical protein A2Z12_02180 [Actinobacteria bacterium RBG_16_68_21]|nr:MAG: hypothetical protein A2Z12_02180 [Actinobacteria bacterium RBG_16_68_21]